MTILNEKRHDGKTRYKVRVRDKDGRFYPQKTFDRKVDAQGHERELLIRRDSGALARSRSNILTFAEFWEQWKTKCRDHVSIGWRKTEEFYYRKYLSPLLGHKSVVDISPDMVRSVLNQPTVLDLQPATRLHFWQLMHRMFVDLRSCTGIDRPNPVWREFRPRVRKVEAAFLEPEASMKLMQFTRNHYLGPAVWIGIHCGLRSCEIQALQVRHLDFAQGQIRLHQIWARKADVLQPWTKTGNQAFVPMSPLLAEYLKGVVNGKSPDDFVAEGPNGGMLDHGTFIKALRRLSGKAGVKEIGPHGLRHSCVALILSNGGSLEDCRRWLNHRSLRAIESYVHRTDERLQGVAARMPAPSVND